MKKVLLFLIFPIISFSQINLCDRSVELSNYFYNSNYNDFVFGLSELKDEVYDYKHLNEIIDFNIARGLFFQESALHVHQRPLVDATAIVLHLRRAILRQALDGF